MDIKSLKSNEYITAKIHVIKQHYHDIGVIQWITSSHKNRMTTRVITLWRVHITSLTKSVSAMHFLIEIKLILKAIKPTFKGSYDKQDLTRVVKGSFHKFHIK